MSNKVTLTGHFTLLDGTPAEGIALIRPSRSPILDLAGKQVIAGPQRFTLDAEGRFSVDLPPTDDPALGENFTYDVMVTMDHTNWQVSGLTLPADMVSVDVLDPPAGVVREYPTRSEWDALTGAAVAGMESALADAETARDTTLDARDTTVVARDETLTARTETITAAGKAESARDVAVGAAGKAESARDVAVGAAGDAEAARDVAVGAAGDAEAARLSAWEAVDAPGRQGPKGDSDVEQLAGAPRLANMVHSRTWIVDSRAAIDSQTDRLIKFTATARLGFISGPTLTAGRRYYFTAEVKTTSDQVYVGTLLYQAYHSGSGDWERLTSRIHHTADFLLTVRDQRSSDWDQIEVRDPVLIDLTAVFGAGREPTTEYMEALLAKYDNYIGGVDQFAVGDALQALTLAGQGMALRHDNSVGTRVFLDHPGGSVMVYGDTGWRDMSNYLPPGVTGTFLARRTTHATDVKISVTLTADSPLIGSRKSPLTNLILGLPNRMFPHDSGHITSLIVREGSSGAPTGTVAVNFQSLTESHLRITSSNAGNWGAGDSIRISGAIPNDQPWPDAQHGTPTAKGHTS